MVEQLTLIFTTLAVILACALVIKLARDLARVINVLNDDTLKAPLAESPDDIRQY